MLENQSIASQHEGSEHDGKAIRNVGVFLEVKPSIKACYAPVVTVIITAIITTFSITIMVTIVFSFPGHIFP